MSADHIPPFDPRRDDPKPPAEPGPGDDVTCANCGERSLDTGLECSNCGFDNWEAVTGKPFSNAEAEFVEKPLHEMTSEELEMLERGTPKTSPFKAGATCK